MSDQGDEDMRFSDRRLLQLETDFRDHQIEQERRWSEALEMIQENTRTTEKLAESVEHIARSTSGVVQLMQDWQGATRVGLRVTSFIKWIAGLGTLGGIIATSLIYIFNHWPKGS